VSSLHITNGDCVASRLREFISDPVVAFADVLHEGPAPAVDDQRWYELRSRFLADDPAQAAGIARQLMACDAAIDRRGGCKEIVLWFEHDLFDQLNLVRALSRILRHRPADGFTQLICVDRFPGFDRFVGLGQLNGRQLLSLFDRKRAVTRAEYELAARAWDAFRSPDPCALASIADDSGAALPFLAGAITRLCAEYPSTNNGLSCSAQELLETLSGGPADGAAVFRLAQDREQHPFMGDWSFFRMAQSLSRARVPLVRIEPDDGAIDLRHRKLSMTEAGRNVLGGTGDAVALNGIDEWRGGVHLSGDRWPWRWDASRRTLVSLA
jgi:GNAT superfamily N-acetyltransferase